MKTLIIGSNWLRQRNVLATPKNRSLPAPRVFVTSWILNGKDCCTKSESILHDPTLAKGNIHYQRSAKRSRSQPCKSLSSLLSRLIWENASKSGSGSIWTSSVPLTYQRVPSSRGCYWNIYCGSTQSLNRARSGVLSLVPPRSLKHHVLRSYGARN